MNSTEHLQKIRDKYCEIAALTARLRPDSPVEEFQNTISLRKDILAQIDRCRSELERQFPDWRTDSQARLIAADVQSLIQHIVNTDNYAREILRENMKKVGNELQSLRRSSTAAQGYTRQVAFKAA